MGHTMYELDVRLRGITPPIWRTIELAGASTLEDLHFAIQVAMGWTNSHLHQFQIGKSSYGMVDVDEATDLEDERSVRLEGVAHEGDTFRYEYDFGDDWEHAITVKRVSKVGKSSPPRCTEGERACPPEDCGGPGGYDHLLRVLADPSHVDHPGLLEWSDDFHPEVFAVPRGGRDLRREMQQLKQLAAADVEDELDLAAVGLPKPLVEAVMALDPLQRASLCALIVGSLAEELIEVRSVATQLVTGLKRQHKPARASRKGVARR